MSELEAAIAAELKPGAPAEEVLAFLKRHGVPYERAANTGIGHPEYLALGVLAYVGEWQGPLFRRGIHLRFGFDSAGRYSGYDAREVEGS